MRLGAVIASTCLVLGACSGNGTDTSSDGASGTTGQAGSSGTPGTSGAPGASGAPAQAGAAGALAQSGAPGVAGSGGIGGAAGAGGASNQAGSGGSLSNAGSAGRGGAAGASGSNNTAGAGGSISTAGAGGSSNTAGAGGSGSGVDCGHAPVDPKATVQARKLLCYLYSIYGKNVLSGQQEMSWNGNPDIDNDYIQQQTGKLPAVRGQDFLYQNKDDKGGDTTSRAQAWWDAGGISQLVYHMGNPSGGDSYDSAKGNCGGGCIGQAITAGTSKNAVLMQRLDHAAAELAKLQAANVAVIWRPWHESNGGWFWWGMEGGGEFVKLYKFAFNYFVNTKGLHNLVWEVSWAQNNPDGSWNPGSGYYDIAGPDTYDGGSPFSGQFQASRSIVGNMIPISLQENGKLPDPSAMFNNGAAPWLLFNTWTQFEYAPGNQYGANPQDYLKKAYADSHTLTRDELPNLK